MGRITREMADKAAKQLAATAYDKKIEKAKNDFKSLVAEIIRTYIPAPILAVMREYSSYLEKSMRIYISDGNDSIYTYHIPIPIPVINEIKVSHNDLAKVKGAKKLFESLENAKRDYEDKVSNALCLSIRTEKRCAEEFPEAMQYLNFSKTTALAPKFDDLRAVLHQ